MTDGSAQDVVLVDGRWAVEQPALLEGGVRHVVARTASDDLAVVRRALDDGTAPAPHEWLRSVDDERHVVVRAARDKESAIARARAFASERGVAERLVANACHIVEELVTNAVFNAPVDEHGRHVHAVRKRTDDVALPEGKHVDVSLRADARRIAITVVDRWGTLRAADVYSYLAKGFRRGADQVDAKEGGAGLGLYQVFDAASHLVVVVVPGVRTEVTALIDAAGTYRAFALETKSLNVFAA